MPNGVRHIILLFLGEGVPPFPKFIGELDLPRHSCSMPYTEYSLRRWRLEQLPECELGLLILFRFDSWAEQFLEEPFLHQAIHIRVIDDLAEVEGLHLRADLGVCL